MSPARRLIAGGRPIALGDRIGRGGEGEVFAIRTQPDLAVKLFTDGKLDARRAKIAAIVRSGLAARSSLVAFPAQVVTEPDGRLVGFTMRRFVDYQPLFELYAPGARKLAFPKANYRFLVCAAANVARAVAAVHEAGCVIGDINQSGVLVSQEALAALIDADSFQFMDGDRRFPCQVGVPSYTPPELHGRSLEGVVRTVDHDRFGLAVVLFQLLFMGRHPYSGAYASGEMPIERAIAEHRFAYSTRRAVGLRPPPGMPTLDDVPPALVAAFEAAFASDRDVPRPSAKDWVALMAAHEADLRVCAANPLHHHASAAKGCPWCRVEDRQGISLFADGGSGGRATRILRGWNDELAEAWRLIEAAGTPAPGDLPNLPAPFVAPMPSRRAVSARRARAWRRVLGVSGVSAGGLVACSDLAPWPIWVAAAVLGCLTLLRDDAPTRALKIEKAGVDRRWAAALAEWRRWCSAEAFRQLRLELDRAKGDHQKLPHTEAKAIAAYRRARRAEQLAAYLVDQKIRANAATAIDQHSVAMLAARGLRSAADIGADLLERVPGLGRRDAARLVAWRAALERGFVYDVRQTATDRQRLAAIRAASARQEAALRRTLLAGAARLNAVRHEIEAQRSVLGPQLAALQRQRAAVNADLRGVNTRFRRLVISVRSPSTPRRRSAVP